MPQSEKFPIGCLVDVPIQAWTAGGGPVPTRHVVPMRVLGYDGLKSVIAEALQDAGNWKKGHVALVPVKDLTRREEVKFIPGEPENQDGNAIGWMELGGLSVALTRDRREGVLLVAFEKAPEADPDLQIEVRVSKNDGADDLWRGFVS